jgi:hypothetical protein
VTIFTVLAVSFCPRANRFRAARSINGNFRAIASADAINEIW